MTFEQTDLVRLEAYLEIMRRFSGFEIKADLRHVGPATTSEVCLAEIVVEFSGRDESLLAANQGEVLLAMESLAADFLQLEGASRDCLRFESAQLRADRRRTIAAMAEAAAEEVRDSQAPYVFPLMNARDRQALQQHLFQSGLLSNTFGADPTRCVVLYPDGMLPSSADAEEVLSEPQALR